LTALDHFIQRTLKPHTYLRYMDDLLVLGDQPKPLQAMADPIDQWLKTHRKQRLNPEKTKLTRLTEGINYLGYRLKQTDTPAEPLQIFSEPLKKWRFIQSIQKLERRKDLIYERPHPLSPMLPDRDTLHEIASFNSRLGSLVHAKTFRFRKKSMEKFLKNTCDHGDLPPELGDSYSPFQAKKGYRSIKLR
jgi:hypothetical protein